MARKLLIGCGILVVICAIVGGIAFFVTQQAVTKLAAYVTTANDFMTALQNSDYTKAYGMLGSDVQTQLGSADAMKQGIEGQGLKPQSWTFNNFNSNSDLTEVAGDVVFTSGTTGTGSIRIRNVNNQYQVAGYTLKIGPADTSTAPTATP